MGKNSVVKNIIDFFPFFAFVAKIDLSVIDVVNLNNAVSGNNKHTV